MTTSASKGLETLIICIPDPLERARWLAETLDLYVLASRNQRFIAESVLYGFEAWSIHNEEDQREIIAFFQSIIAT